MALSGASTVKWRPRGGVDDRQSYKVKNAAVIYHGALVGIEGDPSAAQGYLKPWDTSSGVYDTFCGVAHNTKGFTDYVTGDTSASPVTECEVDISGVTLVYKSVTGVTSIKDVGKWVFATDDTVMTLTDATTAFPVGQIVRYYTSTYVDVKLFSQMEYAAMVGVQRYN
jgi:hypothetical protein